MQLFDTDQPQKSDAEKQAILARVKMPEDWKLALADELTSQNMDNLREFLRQEYSAGKTIYPKGSQMFNAFNLTPLSEVKVVILGQDPYHGPGQAMGLSFSVPKIIPKPPSLNNILKEMADDIGTVPSRHGDLTHWAKQGVLLLNASLTVEEGDAGSHQGKGWEQFTDAVIDVINKQTEHTVFILWGSKAKLKGKFIDTDKHLILSAVHPSPLAANRGGFFGTKPFSKANEYLIQHGKSAIDWQLPQ
ncbi:MAG: uracil-DNA glycosylase [Psychrobacter sanguinis]|nr:uracil-DNA glycosylase [Psychrobacter sanguinis]EGK10949.1 uracil-DNA glycosylase [Psychrobacter sp. 1501(2011)]MCC3307384.1 uracil-DNA glycosylase [Psychrobacter sanguinis]MCC3344793.1 uracil-DNA glycosylase [Psychrobacter sanguinis]MCD9152665.1 uracil-DNA glycosylase [Psychrobacter sanguinis]MDY3305256.1 uracil-DNA glycosylase [Psychrobacter sanguinis]